MLGCVRFCLAIAVVAYHLLDYETGYLGPLAVVSFYVISGFLITLVLNEIYRFRFVPFVANRILRLYPAYAVTALATLALTLTGSTGTFLASWVGPMQAGDLLGNLFVLPWSILSDQIVQVAFGPFWSLHSELPRFRLVPTSWSVGVELVCYLLLWLFIARSTLGALAALALAVAWYRMMPDFLGRYFTVPGAMLPFALGSLAYRLSKLDGLDRFRSGRPAFQLACGAALIAMSVHNWVLSQGQYTTYHYFYVQQSLMVGILVIVGSRKPSGVLGRVDKVIGDLSYPVFLGQYVWAYVAWLALGSPAGVRGWGVFLAGTALNIFVSVLIVRFVDGPIAAIRDRIRKRRDPAGAGDTIAA